MVKTLNCCKITVTLGCLPAVIRCPRCHQMWTFAEQAEPVSTIESVRALELPAETLMCIAQRESNNALSNMEGASGDEFIRWESLYYAWHLILKELGTEWKTE